MLQLWVTVQDVPVLSYGLILSTPFIHEPGENISYKTAYVTSKDSDQPA